MRDVALGATEYFKFTTRQFSTGTPFTLAGSPVISVYEENNTTQITAGITLSVDYDSVTGFNDVAVVATSGNGYESGKVYHLVVTTGTVDGVSVVGEVVGEFSVGKSESKLLGGVIEANVAGAFHVQMLDSAGAPVASQPVTMTRRIDNGAFSAAAGSATNTDSDGMSYVTYNASDVNGTNAVAFKFTASGANNSYERFKLSV